MTPHLIHVPGWGPTSIIEIAWMIVGVLVVCQVVYDLREVLRDLLAADHFPDRAVHEIAWGYVRRELARLFQASILLAVAVFAAVQYPLPGQNTTHTGFGLQIAFVIVGLVVGLQSFMDRRQRAKVNRLLLENGLTTTEP